MSAQDPNRRPGETAHAHLRERYDRLWSAASERIRGGDVERDPVLESGVPDARRGLTLIARPSPQVRQRVAAFLQELRRLEPDQYYYARSEFHLTVLSLFTATVEHGPWLARTAAYVAAIDSARRGVEPIRIQFTGITASPGTIMIQGFVENDALNAARERLRQQLRVRGLDDGLDRRYRLETSHMTVVRFCAPLRNGARLARALERARSRDFGTARIASLSLVRNDWYMSRRVVERLKGYRLGARFLGF